MRLAGCPEFGRVCRSLVVALALGAAPAAGEIGASLSVTSDQRFRGYALSDRRPAGSINLSYDDAGGFYLGGSASAVATRHDGIRLLAVQESAGYARRLGPGLSIDVGVTDARYTRSSAAGSAAGYTEAYLGLAIGNVAARIHYSPNYLVDGVDAAYAEVDAALRPATAWRLTGHAGLLVQTAGARQAGTPRSRVDWRAGVARELGRLTLDLAWAGASTGPDYYYEKPSRYHDALLFSATYLF